MHPEGWERIGADPAQAELLEVLQPELTFVVTEPLVVARAEGVAGVLLADRGDELAVRSIGNNAARVENVTRGGSTFVTVAELAGRIELVELRA